MATVPWLSLTRTRLYCDQGIYIAIFLALASFRPLYAFAVSTVIMYLFETYAALESFDTVPR
jgi:hypothetical protein